MKYMGSKSRIAKYIVPIIQECIDANKTVAYYEPFVGGANIIDKIKCENRYGSDNNKYLIALLKGVQDDIPLLTAVDRELYKSVRRNINAYHEFIVGNVGFLASYNGRFFDGGFAQTGIEKTKNGDRVRNYYEEAKRNLEEQKPKLAGIIFEHLDFKDVRPNIFRKNDFVYCDIPYANTKKYSTSKDFCYQTFYDWARSWSNSTYFLISEENAPSDFVCIWEKPVSRSIKSTDKSVSTEKLFTLKGGLFHQWWQERNKNGS